MFLLLSLLVHLDFDSLWVSSIHYLSGVFNLGEN